VVVLLLLLVTLIVVVAPLAMVAVFVVVGLGNLLLLLVQPLEWLPARPPRPSLVVGLLVDYSLVVVDDVWLLPLEPVVLPPVLVVQLFAELLALVGC
jgi:hypothetical protein